MCFPRNRKEINAESTCRYIAHFPAENQACSSLFRDGQIPRHTSIHLLKQWHMSSKKNPYWERMGWWKEKEEPASSTHLGAGKITKCRTTEGTQDFTWSLGRGPKKNDHLRKNLFWKLPNLSCRHNWLLRSMAFLQLLFYPKSETVMKRLIIAHQGLL